ncbi:MAG: glycosyl hydrolase family 18 protein [Lachnospiraceae bacterium]|nr:glycosyl hydrolase family 18 protein [Lachnospiraceae bacterium]
MAAKRRKKRRRRSRNRRRRMLPVFAAVFFIAVVLGVVFLAGIIRKYSLSDERADTREYFNLTEDDDMAVILQNEKAEENGKFMDGVAYVNFSTVQEYLNSRFYWDANENVLLYALPESLVRVPVGSSEYYVGKEKKDAGYNIVKTNGNTTYVALDFIQEYTDMEYTFYEEPYRVEILYQWGDTSVASLKDDEAVRQKAGIKSPILTDAVKGQKVTVLPTEEEIEDWTKVRTDDGCIGYVRNKKLGTVSTETLASTRDFTEPVYTNISKDYTINMAWHNVTTSAANDTVLSTIASTKGLTTISPTWFTIADNEGNLDSIASAEYVNYAHQSGLEVWAVVDNFKEGVDTYEVLSYTSKRENLINQLIAQAIQYGVDGINVDFERLSSETGVHFIQFVRELSIRCRSNHIILSVDNYVPKAYSSHYYRGEQGIVADYVIIMGYDEHFAGSEESGSVASMNFVREGIEETLKEVPAEKVINAVPFYTRLWKETPKTEAEIASENQNEVGYQFIPYNLSSEALGMQAVEDLLAANGVEPVWDDECKQYYAEYEKDGVTYKVWMEEEQSIEEKAKLLKEYNLAGIAEWKLGLEKSSVWDIILKYVN